MMLVHHEDEHLNAARQCRHGFHDIVRRGLGHRVPSEGVRQRAAAASAEPFGPGRRGAAFGDP